MFNENFPHISVQFLQKSLQTKMTTMIFDRRTFLDVSTDTNYLKVLWGRVSILIMK